MDITIRKEQESDYFIVEKVIREAFWNMYFPGCVEHYLAHKLRSSDDFISDLDFIAVHDNQIIGSIMFTRSYILDKNLEKHGTITFGPLAVLPEYQNQGVGSDIINHAKMAAINFGYQSIVIYGDPDYYSRFGFKSAKSFGISDAQGKYPFAHLALELRESSLDLVSGTFHVSKDFDFREEDVQKYDKKFDPKEKKVTQSQKRFNIISKKFL